MTLDEIRKDIDAIDARILALLGERMEKALLARRLKPVIEDKGREAAIMERLERTSRCLVRPGFSTALYERIIAEAKALQFENPLVAGFQGGHGAYAEMAAKAWKPGAATIPCRDNGEVFEAVAKGWLDAGIVPVEESLACVTGAEGGPAGAAVGAAASRSGLHVVAAIDLPVEHCLLAPRGADHRELRAAYSHPQVLAQCRHFLERNHLEPKASGDSAGAARMLAEGAPKGAAAVASRFAAELYDLEIIKEGIQDAEASRTRFFVVSRDEGEGDGEMCSASFRIDDRAGAVSEVLAVLAKAELNLTRIESLPDGPGEYVVFVDFRGSRRDSRVQAALAEAGAVARDFRLLGCYREIRL